MMWFFAVLVVLALGAVAAVAAGRGTPMAPAYPDRPDVPVPERGLIGARDLRRVRFTLAFRGYRMDEVDSLLDRLARQLEDAQEDAAGTTTRSGAPRPGPTPPVSDPGRPASASARTRPRLLGGRRSRR